MHLDAVPQAKAPGEAAVGGAPAGRRRREPAGVWRRSEGPPRVAHGCRAREADGGLTTSTSPQPGRGARPGLGPVLGDFGGAALSVARSARRCGGLPARGRLVRPRQVERLPSRSWARPPLIRLDASDEVVEQPRLVRSAVGSARRPARSRRPLVLRTPAGSLAPGATSATRRTTSVPSSATAPGDRRDGRTPPRPLADLVQPAADLRPSPRSRDRNAQVTTSGTPAGACLRTLSR